ncbi:MAG: two-component system response regulator [Hydrogenophilales bacterium 28-61-23]|nr:MAG: two-component system response regulator [Hydrogenophilales bacterium 28-61-23]
MGWHIMIVDDDPLFAHTLAFALQRRGHTVVTAEAISAAQTLAEVQIFDAVVLDLRLGAESGLHLIEPLRARQPEARILLLTGYASIATAVAAIKLGAVQYLPKPASVDEILTALGDGFLADGVVANINPPDTPLSVDRLEWEHIQKVLAQHEGNLSATARALKMHRRTLQRKLAKRPVKA